MSVTLAAVADPTRRSILLRLADGPASVTDLARPFDMSQQAVSKHLAYLESARLIHKQREGRLNICSLSPEPLREVADWAENYRRLWEMNFRRLDALLDQLKARDHAHARPAKSRRKAATSPVRSRPHSRSKPRRVRS